MRFLIDTNVVSELVRPRPDAAVLTWFAERSALDVGLSVLSLGEIAKGIAVLSQGTRWRQLETWLQREIPTRFQGRVIEVDSDVAIEWARLAVAARQDGRPLGVIDGLLLATASVHDLTFVTRNIRECEGRGVPVLNPWEP